jgi:3-hydroxyacyl-[acyl-carrier-protein] dehydratase
MEGDGFTTRELVDFIPQKRPFLFVDEILEVSDQHVIGTYTYRHEEFFYKGHFPGNAVTPGAILLETMCQIGVVAFGLQLVAREKSREEALKLRMMLVDAAAEFFQSIVPGQRIIVIGRRIYWRRLKLRCEMEMKLDDGTAVASGMASGMGVLL